MKKSILVTYRYEIILFYSLAVISLIVRRFST